MLAIYKAGYRHFAKGEGGGDHRYRNVDTVRGNGHRQHMRGPSPGPFDDTFNFPQYSRLPPHSSVGTTIAIRATNTLVEISERVLVSQRCRCPIAIKWGSRQFFTPVITGTIRGGGDVLLRVPPSATPKPPKKRILLSVSWPRWGCRIRVGVLHTRRGRRQLFFFVVAHGHVRGIPHLAETLHERFVPLWGFASGGSHGWGY